MKSISKELLEAIKNVSEWGELDRYSGRGMDGRECLGISISVLPTEWTAYLVEEILTLFEDETAIPVFSELSYLLEDGRTDSLGMGTIFYFPHYEYPEE